MSVQWAGIQAYKEEDSYKVGAGAQMKPLYQHPNRGLLASVAVETSAV